MDKRIRLSELTRLGINKIPEELHPEWDDLTMASSLAAVTSVDPRSGGIFDIKEMAALCGDINPYYLKKIFRTEPGAEFVWSSGDVFATYGVSSLATWWDQRATDKRERLVEKAKALQPVATSAAKAAARSRFERRVIPLDRY